MDRDHARRSRALQAAGGIVIAAAGVGAMDWRAGLVAFGLLTLVTSGFWRTTP